MASQKNVDGIVVTHGTDTLDETAYFLNLTINTYKPVVLTGAMRPASATSADGPINLYQAVCLASCDDALGHGVMAVFSSTIDPHFLRGVQGQRAGRLHGGYSGQSVEGYPRHGDSVCRYCQYFV